MSHNNSDNIGLWNEKSHVEGEQYYLGLLSFRHQQQKGAERTGEKDFQKDCTYIWANLAVPECKTLQDVSAKENSPPAKLNNWKGLLP